LVNSRNSDHDADDPRFFVFNCYRLGIGIDSEWGCTEGLVKTSTLKADSDVIAGNATLSRLTVFAVDAETNETTLIGERSGLGQVIWKFGLIHVK
jgi:hypothetical protein